MLYLANSWDNKVWNRIINSRWPQHISPFWSGFLCSESSSEVQIHILAFLEHQSFALKVIEVKSEICEVRIIIIITSTAKRFQTKKNFHFILSLSLSQFLHCIPRLASDWFSVWSQRRKRATYQIRISIPAKYQHKNRCFLLNKIR